MSLSDADISALFITLRLAGLTTITLLLLGTPLAWWLARSKWRFKFLLEALIALPLAHSGFLTAAVLGFAHTLGEFGVVLMIGGNIPGRTQVLSIARVTGIRPGTPAVRGPAAGLPDADPGVCRQPPFCRGAAMSIQVSLKLEKEGFLLDVDLGIPARGITALFGPSVCGKTTLLRAIAGLEPKARGVLRMGGQVWQDGDCFLPPHRRPLGYVFQEASLFPHLNVRKNLEYGLRRVPADQRISGSAQGILGQCPSICWISASC